MRLVDQLVHSVPKSRKIGFSPSPVQPMYGLVEKIFPLHTMSLRFGQHFTVK